MAIIHKNILKKLPIISLLFSLILFIILFFVYKNFNTKELIDSLDGVSLKTIIIAVVIMWFNFLINTLRFKYIISVKLEGSVSFFTLFHLNLLGVFAAHLAPVGPAADLVRFGYARWKLKLPTKPLVEAIIMDRFIALIGLAVTGICSLPIQWYLSVEPLLVYLQALLWGACFSSAVIVYVLGRQSSADPNRKLFTALTSFGMVFRAVLRGWSNVFLQMVCAIGYSGSFCLLMWVFANDMGIQTGIWFFLTFSSLVLLSQSLPIFYAGWGAREFTAITVMGSVGTVSVSEAASIGVCAGVALFLASLPGAVLHFHGKKNKFADHTETPTRDVV
ncbi:MAG: lysylphosphatidylglycerol synthase transmembrane domain-containing protein [Pseudomonadota bacterium]|nr:lysylphosphatidylglycerol synthase transmembrane domain-containing protein [Pseudomonadota bacterium]